MTDTINTASPHTVLGTHSVNRICPNLSGGDPMLARSCTSRLPLLRPPPRWWARRGCAAVPRQIDSGWVRVRCRAAAAASVARDPACSRRQRRCSQSAACLGRCLHGARQIGLSASSFRDSRRLPDGRRPSRPRHRRCDARGTFLCSLPIRSTSLWRRETMQRWRGRRSGRCRAAGLRAHAAGWASIAGLAGVSTLASAPTA